MQTVGTSEARTRLPDLVSRAMYQQLFTVLARRGRPAAVLVSVEWYEAHRGADDAPVNTRGALPAIPGHE